MSVKAEVIGVDGPIALGVGKKREMPSRDFWRWTKKKSGNARRATGRKEAAGLDEGSAQGLLTAASGDLSPYEGEGGGKGLSRL